ncbi:MAG: class I SAM-dependent methyltransferase [Cyclobacteriaceae bacterium]
MPTIEENKKSWNENYSWINRGDEWSMGWGSVQMQWYTCILPRIQNFLPTQSILEIACGHGRWTNLLKASCDHIIGVDLAEQCIKVCKERFKQDSNSEFYVNDGKSLSMAKDSSINFIFSFDSLVHANKEVMESYLPEICRILTPGGVAFIHHSNLEEHFVKFRFLKKMPFLAAFLSGIGLIDENLHWRDSTVSAYLFRSIAEECGLKCKSQEIIKWGTKKVYNDCFTVLCKTDEDIATKIERNKFFNKETENSLMLTKLYDEKNLIV